MLALPRRAPSLLAQLGHFGLSSCIDLLDHLVRPLQKRLGDRQAERLRGLEVDDELELGGLFDRKVAWSCPLEMYRRAASYIDKIFRDGSPHRP